MVKFSPTLGTFSSYIASILEIPSYLYIVCICTCISQSNKEYALHIYFLGTFRTLGGSDAHEHQGRLGFTLGKAKPPSGATTGGTPECPQKRQCFFEKNSISKFLVYLER